MFHELGEREKYTEKGEVVPFWTMKEYYRKRSRTSLRIFLGFRPFYHPKSTPVSIY